MSDFWTDLQAWTQAQVDALLRDSARTRKKNLASDINRLLRDRVAKTLTIKDGKSIAAEFLRTGGRIAPPITIPLAIDHGWLTGNYTDAVIYTWSSLAAVLTAQGYIIGGSGEYDSVVTRTANPTMFPEDYSGLMRLLVQAFIGSGRDINIIKPAGWSLSATKCGIVRSPSGVYWLANWGAGIGVKLARLTYPVEFDWLMATLASGKLSADLALVAEAEILGQVSLASPLDAVTLFTTSAPSFSAIYAGPPGAYSETIWGWCGRYQRRKASDEHISGAVVLTHYMGYTYVAGVLTAVTLFRESVLSIDWSNPALPVGTITEAASGRVPGVPATDKYKYLERVSTYHRINSLVLPYLDESAVWYSGVGSLLSCFGPDGSIQRLEVFGGHSKSEGRSIPNDVVNWCPATTVDITAFSESHEANYRFSGNTPSGISERVRREDWDEHWVLTSDGDPGGAGWTLVSGTGNSEGWFKTEGMTTPGTGYSSMGPIAIIVGGPGQVYFVAGNGADSWVTSFVGTWSYESNLCDGRYDTSDTYLIVQVGEEYNAENLSITHSVENARRCVTACLDDGSSIVQDQDSGLYVHMADLITNVISPYDTLSVSYGGRQNLMGEIYPAGLDAAGAEIDGQFCGGA